MAATLSGVFEESLRDRIAESKILVVGAGGIGCEILKNLVLSGFPSIEIIDLDTIDVSNLNRQFLFHKEHVGKSKAQVARESALSFNPNVEIKAYHDSITTTNYGVNFFQEFDLVLNALDNRQARNHVNRMCLTADVPLIESGTAGYNGQVELIKKGLTQCYECTPKAAQKSYPGCTIRNTPSEPIHCIVWAKHLFNQLFGETNEDEEVSPDTADPEAAGGAGADALNSEANEKGNVERVNTRQWAQSCQYDGEKLFNKFFHDDIQYLLSMSNLWKSRVPPTPMKWGEFGEEAEVLQANQESVLPDQRTWSIAECAKVFADSIQTLRLELAKLPESDHLVWDKDDKAAMDFVAACANVRAHIFNIARKSRFDIKSMAGNIIPAIATTNAITAGIVVMHAFKVLQGEYDKCKSVYMRLRPNARNQLFVPDRSLNPPNPKCYVCSPKPEVILKVDTNKVTVKELRDEILIKALNMTDPDVILDVKGVIVISSEEDETECNNDKKLFELGIVNGAILKVDDFFQKYELSITVVHIDAEHDQPLFEVVADPDSLKPAQEVEENGKVVEGEETKKNGNDASEAKRPKLDGDDNDDVSALENKEATIAAVASSSRVAAEDDDDDDLCVVEDDEDDEAGPVAENSTTTTMQGGAGLKRKPADGGEGPSCVKRAKVDEEDDDLILIDD